MFNILEVPSALLFCALRPCFATQSPSFCFLRCTALRCAALHCTALYCTAPLCPGRCTGWTSLCPVPSRLQVASIKDACSMMFLLVRLWIDTHVADTTSTFFHSSYPRNLNAQDAVNPSTMSNARRFVCPWQGWVQLRHKNKVFLGTFLPSPLPSHTHAYTLSPSQCLCFSSLLSLPPFPHACRISECG